MMKTTELLELIQVEVPPVAEAFAKDLFEGLNQQLTEQLEEKINDWLGDTFRSDLSAEEFDSVLPKIAEDLIQPAFQFYVAGKMEEMFADSVSGWSKVWWENMTENYKTTG